MSDKIRWGVLGTANIAKQRLIPAIQQSCNGMVQAVASRHLGKARTFADELGIPQAYGSYEELLADPKIDAIYIPLPVSLHAEWSIRAAEAGKPVLCEKPLAANAAEGRKIAEAARRCQVPIMEAIMFRYHPLTCRVKEMLVAGAVGEVQLVRASFTCKPQETEGNIRFSKELAGGALLDVGSYCVSLMRLAVGQEPNQVRSLACFGAQSGVDEWMTGVLGFPSGALGYFGCSLKSGFDCSYDMIGSTGRLLVDRGGMAAWPNEDFKIKHWSGGDYQEIVVPQANSYQLMVEDFADALRNKRLPRVALEESIRNLEVMDRLLQAAE